MTTATLKIHSENILPIIKRWLYSDRDIFVRELVSNGCDACQKLRRLRDLGEPSIDDATYRIDIAIDKKARTLTFSDTGIGMDAAEIEKYIAQIAFSGAEEFVAKYQSAGDKEQIIGHFGLGFYSAFMVAERVSIDSLSYRPGSAAALWQCDGSPEYTLGAGARTKRGTEITLQVSEESAEVLDEVYLRKILLQYCAFLPIPIYLNGALINSVEPLWLKSVADCTDQDYLKFYRYLYPLDEEPLFWIHLSVDYPFHLKGILYFPRVRKQADYNKSYLKLYCNRVFVSEECRDLLPDYLALLRGAIDSSDIPLNVSRSTLQMDRTVRQLATHISKKVSDRLATLYRTEREKFLAAWPDLSWIIKLGALQDEKFYERVKEFLVWKTSEGEWSTIEDYKGSTLYYTTEAQGPVLGAYRARGITVLIAEPLIDTHLIGFLESKLSGIKFQRIDGALDEALLDSSRENTLLDATGRTSGARLAAFVRTHLADQQLEVEAKSLASDALPALLLLEEKSRRLRDILASSGNNDLWEKRDQAQTKKTFVLNTNHPLVSAIQRLEETKPDLAGQLVQELFDLTRLGQQEMAPSELPNFLQRTQGLLVKLVG